MCVSLPGMFSNPILALQVTKMQRYILCLTSNCAIYLIDIITMKIVKIYTTNDQHYINHVYINCSHSLWIIDSLHNAFFWRLADTDDMKILKKYNRERVAEAELPKHMNPLSATTLPTNQGKLTAMEKCGEKDLIVCFEKAAYIIKDVGQQPGQEIKQFPFEIEKEGDIIASKNIERQNIVVIITTAWKMYYLSSEELTTPGRKIIAKKIVNLKGHKFDRFDARSTLLVSFSERVVLSVLKSKQTIYVWELWKLDVEGSRESQPITELTADIQKPWKALAKTEENQVRTNSYLDSCNFFMKTSNLAVFQKGEKITANITHASIELSSPLYIVGTNFGNIFMYRVFMSDLKSISPIIIVESHKAAINQLCVKKDKLLATSVDGTLSITDLSADKLQKVAEKYYAERKNKPLDSKEKFVQNYRDTSSHVNLIPGGVSGFLEIQSITEDIDRGDNSLDFEIIKKNRPSSLIEDHLGIVGYDNCVLIISLSTMNIAHRYKGHDSKVVGLYLHEKVNYLVVLTSKLTVYLYSVASRRLERKTNCEHAYQIFNLQERVDRYISKDGHVPKYGEIFKQYAPKDNPLKKGCHKTLDFCHFMEMMWTDWRCPNLHKENIYNTMCNEIGASKMINEPWLSKDVIMQIYNKCANIKSRIYGKFEQNSEKGFVSLQLKIGKTNTKDQEKAKHDYISYKGKLSKSSSSTVFILFLEDLLSYLQKNYKVVNKGGQIVQIFDRNNPSKKEEQKAAIPSKESPAFLNIELAKVRADSLWPLPLMSLIHFFGFNEKIDKDLGDEFCIYPPLLQLWIGLPGVENSFSFAVPEVLENNWKENHGFYDWKVSPYLNSIQSVMLFSSFVTIFHFNEQFIASIINHLLQLITNFLSTNKAMPYLSFAQISQFLLSRDPDIWSTSRDIIFKPFMHNARPETYMNLALQVSNLINNVYDKIRKDPCYKKAIGLLRDQTVLHKFDFLNFINKYFGEVELKGILILAYSFNEHADLVANYKTVKRCIRLIAFIIGY